MIRVEEEEEGPVVKLATAPPRGAAGSIPFVPEEDMETPFGFDTKVGLIPGGNWCIPFAFGGREIGPLDVDA